MRKCLGHILSGSLTEGLAMRLGSRGSNEQGSLEDIKTGKSCDAFYKSRLRRTSVYMVST